MSVAAFLAELQRCDIRVWSDGDEAWVRQMTFTSFKDDVAGFSVRHYFGGPGWAAMLEAMGFPAP